MLLKPRECTVTIKILLLQNSSFIMAIKCNILRYECYLLSLSNLTATQGCQPFKSSHIENWQARDDRLSQNAYDLICDDAIWCHFWKNICWLWTMYAPQEQFIVSCLHKWQVSQKTQTLVIIPKISDSKLETRKYGPKSVPGLSGVLTALAICKIQKNI